MATDNVETLQPASSAAVNGFWFDELAPRDWFAKSAALDCWIERRFGATLAAAAAGRLSAWRDQPEGRLAEILVLDQFTRNIHRDSARAFENDPRALELARAARATGADAALPPRQRAFVYMPFMHSESRVDHETALTLYKALGVARHLKAERQHFAIIDRFGRYPHRNALLGRLSTPEERAFLAEPNSSF